MTKVLFLTRDDGCAGPIARAWAQRVGLEARSAATHHPCPAIDSWTAEAIAVAAPNGGPVHHAELVTSGDLVWADVMVVVDRSFEPHTDAHVVRWGLSDIPAATPADVIRRSMTIRRRVVHLLRDLADLEAPRLDRLHPGTSWQLASGDA